MDAIIICVPTPLNEYHEPDLSYITDTTHAIAPHLRAGQLVVLESTTYPGTTEEVMVPILEKENRANLKAARENSDPAKEFFVAFSPEREDPGNTTVARKDIPKVVGGLNKQPPKWLGALRFHLQPHSAGLIPCRGGDDQAAGKHLPLREHRAGQRTQAALPADEPQHLGSHRRGRHQALWISSLLSRPGPRRTLHSRRPVLSFLESKRSGLPHPLHRTRR